MTSSWHSGLAALVALGACGGEERARDIPGLVEARVVDERPIDVGLATTDVAELVRAANLSHGLIGVGLGAHRLVVESATEVSEGGKVVEKLTDSATIDLAAEGDFHAIYANSRDYGRDVYFVAGELYLRPRYGKYNIRPPLDDAEPGRIRSEIASALGATLSLVAPGLALSDGGARDVAGRKARVVKLAAGQGPARGELPPQQAWRKDAVVRSVAGEVALDAELGFALAGAVDAVVELDRDGRRFAMKLHVVHTTSSVGQVAAIVAPGADQIAPVATATQELAERESLLEGIAPPAARARTPDNPTGAASAASPKP